MSSTYNKGKTRKLYCNKDGTELKNMHCIDTEQTTIRLYEMQKSFISAGGNAEWLFLVFKHNEHQLEENKKDYQKEYGFKRFLTVYTTRFHSGQGYKEYSLDGWDYRLEETTIKEMPNLSTIPKRQRT